MHRGFTRERNRTAKDGKGLIQMQAKEGKGKKCITLVVGEVLQFYSFTVLQKFETVLLLYYL